MTNDKKKKVLNGCGLCWHEYKQVSLCPARWICGCGKVVGKYNAGNLDPDSPEDMYGKIIPEFKKNKGGIWVDFQNWIWVKLEGEGYEDRTETEVATSAPDLAAAMLEYFREQEKNND